MAEDDKPGRFTRLRSEYGGREADAGWEQYYLDLGWSHLLNGTLATLAAQADAVLAALPGRGTPPSEWTDACRRLLAETIAPALLSGPRWGPVAVSLLADPEALAKHLRNEHLRDDERSAGTPRAAAVSVSFRRYLNLQRGLAVGRTAWKDRTWQRIRAAVRELHARAALASVVPLRPSAAPMPSAVEIAEWLANTGFSVSVRTVELYLEQYANTYTVGDPDAAATAAWLPPAGVSEDELAAAIDLRGLTRDDDVPLLFGDELKALAVKGCLEKLHAAAPDLHAAVAMKYGFAAPSPGWATLSDHFKLKRVKKGYELLRRCLLDTLGPLLPRRLRP